MDKAKEFQKKKNYFCFIDYVKVLITVYDMDPEHVGAFVDAVHKHSRLLRQN